MKYLPLLFLLGSCTYTDGQRNVAVGGKGAARGADYAVVWDNEKSLSDAMIAGTIIAGGYFQAGVSKAKEVTTRTLDANRSSEVINASNNATKIASEGIAADVTKTTTLPK